MSVLQLSWMLAGPAPTGPALILFWGIQRPVGAGVGGSESFSIHGWHSGLICIVGSEVEERGREQPELR